MADINIAKAPPNYAVLPFYGTGALFFLVLAVMMLFTPGEWGGHYFTPHLLAMTHTAALGWGSMIIFGSAYQLLPVICENDLFSSKMALASYGYLTVGAGLLITSFWLFTPGWMMITGGALVVTAAGLYGVNAYLTMGSCKRYSVQKLFILASAGWLLVTTLAGLLLAINLYEPFIFRSHLDMLKLHAHAGLAGWFLQLITGVSSKLVPMFLLGKSGKTKLLYGSFVFQNAGLVLFLVHGLVFGFTPRIFFYEGLIVLGVVAWLIWLFDCYRNRVRKAIDLPMRHVFFSCLCLSIALLLPPALYYSHDHAWALVYGLLLFQGWITFLILGMTFKTLPFIVWNYRYKHLSGKIKVPMPKHLYHEKWLRYQLGIHTASLLLLLAGVALRQEALIRTGIWVALATAALYVGNVVTVMFYKIKTPADATVHR